MMAINFTGGTWNGLSTGSSGGLSGSPNGVIQHTEYPDGDLNDGLVIDPGGGGVGLDGGGGTQQLSMDSYLCQTFSSLNLNFSLDDAMGFNMSLCNGLTDGMIETDPGEYDALKEVQYLSLVIVLYIIVILVGAIGNVMVVITVVKTRQMWNATNIFIANLAISDVFVCVFDLPLSAHYQITDRWIFGEALCHVILPALAVVAYDSTLTLTLISIDRYLLIVFPLKRKFTVRIAIVFVAIIAVVSLAVAFHR